MKLEQPLASSLSRWTATGVQLSCGGAAPASVRSQDMQIPRSGTVGVGAKGAWL